MTKLISAILACLLSLQGMAYAGNNPRYTNKNYCFGIDRLNLWNEYPVGIAPEMAGHGVIYVKNINCQDAMINSDKACTYLSVSAAYAVTEEENQSKWFETLNNSMVANKWHMNPNYIAKINNINWHISEFSKTIHGHIFESIIYQTRTHINMSFEGGKYTPTIYVIQSTFKKNNKTAMENIIKSTVRSFVYVEPCR
jgi:hypothetical protein